MAKSMMWSSVGLMVLYVIAGVYCQHVGEPERGQIFLYGALFWIVNILIWHKNVRNDEEEM